MLTNIEKEKIRLEETYRDEIKIMISKKERKKSFFAKLLSFFESSLGLWLLSAVFLTFGVKLYEDYKAKTDDVKKANEQIEKIDLEIGFRYTKIFDTLIELNYYDTVSIITSDSNKIKGIFLSMGNSVNRSGNFLYVDFSNWGLLSLLAEEKRLLSHMGKNTNEIETVMGHLAGLKFFSKIKEIDFANIKKVAGHIQNELWLSRWKTSGFYYSEGSMRTPFP